MMLVNFLSLTNVAPRSGYRYMVSHNFFSFFSLSYQSKNGKINPLIIFIPQEVKDKNKRQPINTREDFWLVTALKKPLVDKYIKVTRRNIHVTLFHLLVSVVCCAASNTIVQFTVERTRNGKPWQNLLLQRIKIRFKV